MLSFEYFTIVLYRVSLWTTTHSVQLEYKWTQLYCFTKRC